MKNFDNFRTVSDLTTASVDLYKEIMVGDSIAEVISGPSHPISDNFQVPKWRNADDVATV
jgi:hypothetical protein